MSSLARFFALIVAFFTMIFLPSTIFEKTADIKAMTFNIYFSDLTETRLDAIKQQIEAVNPDVFGLQELKDKSKNYLKSEIPQYHYLVISDEDETSRQYNGIYWLKAKYNMIDSGSIYLSATPDKPGSGWDARHTRMLIWVLLEEKKTGFKFIAADTHLDHTGSVSRAESLKLIDKTLAEYNYPIILLGDFNCRYSNPELPAFDAMGWTNTMKLSGITTSTDTFHSNNGSDINNTPIDHIFVKNAESAENWNIHKELYNGMYPSDHFALSVDIHFSYKISARQNYELIKNS